MFFSKADGGVGAQQQQYDSEIKPVTHHRPQDHGYFDHASDRAPKIAEKLQERMSDFLREFVRTVLRQPFRSSIALRPSFGDPIFLKTSGLGTDFRSSFASDGDFALGSGFAASAGLASASGFCCFGGVGIGLRGISRLAIGFCDRGLGIRITYAICGLRIFRSVRTIGGVERLQSALGFVLGLRFGLCLGLRFMFIGHPK